MKDIAFGSFIYVILFESDIINCSGTTLSGLELMMNYEDDLNIKTEI